jgi:hypothetical protein
MLLYASYRSPTHIIAEIPPSMCGLTVGGKIDSLVDTANRHKKSYHSEFPYLAWQQVTVCR